MKILYNNPILRKRRKILRINQTDCERILWNQIKNKQCNGFKFFRQYSVGPYILDFYCPRLRLAIELDGGQHNERQQREYDLVRSAYIKGNNITELRFWNNDITENLDGVYERILEYCDN